MDAGSFVVVPSVIGSLTEAPSKRTKRHSGCKRRAVKRSVVESIRPIATVEAEGLNPIANEEWKEIEVAVDSGATENVISLDISVSVPITPGPAFMRGVKY